MGFVTIAKVSAGSKPPMRSAGRFRRANRVDERIEQPSLLGGKTDQRCEQPRALNQKPDKRVYAATELERPATFSFIATQMRG